MPDDKMPVYPEPTKLQGDTKEAKLEKIQKEIERLCKERDKLMRET